MIITIPLQTILDRIHTRSYYIGESYKAKDIDYSIVQSSIDNVDELGVSIDIALSNIAGMLIKRVKDFTYDLEEDCIIDITPYGREPENGDSVVKLLENAIIDYCVQYSVYHWLLVLKPEIASPIGSLLPLIEDKIIKYIGMISNPVKRRYTAFGI